MKSFKQFILEYFTLLENRIDFLKQNFEGKLKTDHDTLAKHQTTPDIVDHFANNADPTKNKAHTQWILKQYQQKKIRQEDHPRIKETLSNFEQHKNKLANKDINSYKSLNDIEDAVKPHLGTEEPVSKRQETKKIKDEGSEIIHDSPDFTVRKLKTKEAACHYGAGTKWCTAAKGNNNMFDHYNKSGPMYVIHHKDENGNQRKFQYHPASNQFMDERDEGVNMEYFVKQHPQMKNIGEFQGYHYSMPLSQENKEKLHKEFHNLIDDKNMLSDVKEDKINKMIDSANDRGYLHKSHIQKIAADDNLEKAHHNLAYLHKYSHLELSPQDISNLTKANNSIDAHELLASKHNETLDKGYPTLSSNDIDTIMKNPKSTSAHSELISAHSLRGNVLKPEHLDTMANNPNALSAHAKMITGNVANKQHLDTIINNPNSTDAHRSLINRHLDRDSYPGNSDKLTDNQLSKILSHGKVLDPITIGRLLDADRKSHIRLNDDHMKHIINNSHSLSIPKIVAHITHDTNDLQDANQYHVKLLKDRIKRDKEL